MRALSTELRPGTEKAPETPSACVDSRMTKPAVRQMTRRAFSVGASSLACGLGCGLAAGATAPPTPIADGDAAPLLKDAGTAVALPGTREFSVRSAGGLDYRVQVAVPPGDAPAQGYATLMLLDGNAYFAAAAQAMRMLASYAAPRPAGDSPPPLLIVGVGYPGDAPLHGARRTWDFLPPPRDPSTLEAHRARLRAAPGGADAFLDFLLTELRPALHARYTLRPDWHTLAGHSLGGYFTLHALMQRPQAFQRYAAISPSLWWDGERLIDEMALAQPQRARVLLAVARNETPGFPDRSAAMLNGARRMRSVLAQRGVPAASLQYEEVDDEDHLSMPFARMPSVLRFAASP